MNTCHKKTCPGFPVSPPLNVPGWAAMLLCARHGLDLARDDSIAATLDAHLKAALVMDAHVGAGNVAGVQSYMDAFMATRAAVRAAVRTWLDTPDVESRLHPSQTDVVRKLVVKVRCIQAHVEAGPPHERLTAATVLCSEVILESERWLASNATEPTP